MPTELMIDIEALGKGYRGIVLSIGMARFDPAGEGVEQSINLWLSLKEQEKLGRIIDVDTLHWWKDVAGGMPEADRPRMRIKDALSGLNSWIDACDAGVWALPPSYDLAVLQSLYEDFRVRPAWRRKHWKCARTVIQLAGIERVESTKKHNSEHDAIAQALSVQRAIKALFRRREELHSPRAFHHKATGCGYL